MACISCNPRFRNIVLTSPVRTLSFASMPMIMRLPSFIHFSNWRSRSLMKALRGFRGSRVDRKCRSCWEYTVPGLSVWSGFGRYPLITRSLMLSFPVNRVQTQRPMPVSSSPDLIALWEHAPVAIWAVPPNSTRFILLSCRL